MKTLIKILSITSIFAFVSSCCNLSEKESFPGTAYKLKNDKSVFIYETHPVGQSLSTIEINSKGFENELAEVIEEADPISAVLLGDLDQNGFGEIYIVLTAAGSGSYGSILGFASNNDKSLSQIYLPEVDKENVLFKEYQGHDSFTIEKNKLVRSFPMDISNDSIQMKRIVIYSLYAGEATWQLKIDDSMIEIKN